MSDALICLEALSFRYNSRRLILDNVSARLGEGELVCLLGPNGAGKSTLLKCIMGLLKPCGGTVLAEGENVADLSFRRRATLMAYVPQHSTVVFDHTVREYVTMGLAARYPMWKSPSAADKQEVERYLERMELTHLADAPFRSLSGGEQQKTTIARALVQQPKVLLFDEPTSALDLGNRNKVLQLIRSLAADGYSILMTTHDPDHPFALESNVWLLNRRGELTAGTLAQTMTPQNLSALYDTSVEVVRLPEHNKTVCIVK